MRRPCADASAGGFAGRLETRDEYREEQGDDRNDYEQLDQRECGEPPPSAQNMRTRTILSARKPYISRHATRPTGLSPRAQY